MPTGSAVFHLIEALPNFIVAAPAMRELVSQVIAVCDSHAPVLITGETGTGKELLARAIHLTGNRRNQLFTPFNCTGLSLEIADSQLFGHRRGSFTGALNDQPGIIRASEGGTLFLDEIGELSLELQPKLLRFLQEGEVHPVGAAAPFKTDVRVVVATNLDLPAEVKIGRFRQDLFYRLNVVPLHIPPLRERREEIPPLIEYYFDLYLRQAGKENIQLSQQAIELMMRYDWPGNVRELCHELQRLALFAMDGEAVDAARLSPAIINQTIQNKPNRQEASLSETVAEVERQLIVETLIAKNGNLTHTATMLKLTIKGLKDKMRRLGIEKSKP